MVITIDGLCVNGKTTLAKLISDKFNFKNFGAGAIYRCIAYEILNKNLDIQNIQEIIYNLKDISVDFDEDRVLLYGVDVTEEIRKDEISILSTKLGLIPEIKKLVREIQKEYIKKYDTVMEGRDIGTRIAPEAEIKFYLYSDFETRVKRKHMQNPDTNIEDTRKNILVIDELDAKGNFVKPQNAIEIKTDDKSIQEVFEIMKAKIEEKINK